MADRENFHLTIICPTRIFYEADAEMLEFNCTEGEMGVYARHVPTTVVLEPGVMRITEKSGEIKMAAVHSGFVEILKDRISVMAEVAEWPEEIDLNRAKEAEARAQRRLQSNDPQLNYSRAQIALHKALVRQELLGAEKK